MANFAQTNPIQYKDYVAVNPIEAMTAVGINREKERAAGLQKVNDHYSRVAGVDVLRDVDKQNLQNNLNALKSGVASNLSGDFSDSRIVNQITGAAQQIYKDPSIRNAINSTIQVRKGQAEMEEARKAGKSNPNNEDYFNDKVSKYVQDGDVKTSFNDSYKPYVNVLQKITEVTSKAGIDSKVVDYIYNKNGQPLDVMTEEEYKTNYPKIKAAIDLVMQDGSVRQQLQIDGWAKYRGYTAGDLFNPMVAKFNEDHVKNEQDKLDQSIIASSSASKELKDAAALRLTEITQREVDSKSNLDYLRSLAESNPDGFKEQLYTTQYKDNLLETLSTTEHNTRHKTNPAMEQYMKIINLNWEKEKERNSNYYKADTKKLEWMKFYADNEQDPTTGEWSKKDKTNTKNGGLKPVTGYGENSTDVPKRLAEFKEEMTTLGTGLQATATDLVYDYLSIQNDGKNKQGTALTKADAISQVKQWAAVTGETPEEFALRFAMSIPDKLGNKKAPAQIQAKLDDFIKNKELHQAYALAEAQADKEAYDISKISRFDANVISSGKEGTAIPLGQPIYATNFSSNKTTTIPLEDQKKLDLFNKAKQDALAKIIPYYNNQTSAPSDQKSTKLNLSQFISRQNLEGMDAGQKSLAAEALTAENSVISFKHQQPTSVGGSWKNTAVILYKGNTIERPSVPDNMTGQSLGTFHTSPEDIFMNMSGTNSTSSINPYAPSAYKQAYYGSDKFKSLSPKTPYTVKANLIKVDGGTEVYLYVKNGDQGFSQVSAGILPNDPNISTADVAKKYMSSLTDAQIEALLKKK